MSRPLRIVVADDEPDMRKYFQKLLPRLGHEVLAAAETGVELVARCRALKPDLVITDIKMPDMDGIEAAVQIYGERPVPIILVSAFHDPELIERAEADHILGYLVKPIKPPDLEPAIALALRRFEQFEDLRREAADLRQALEDRKVIERAKGTLMRRGPMDEEAAFRRLQQFASERRQKLVEAARLILVVEEASQAPKKDG
jgi:response regulator NasT